MKKALTILAALALATVAGCDALASLTGGDTAIDIDVNAINRQDQNQGGATPTPIAAPTPGDASFALACATSPSGSSIVYTASGGTPPFRLFVNGTEVPGAFVGEGRTSMSVNQPAGTHTGQAQDAGQRFSTLATCSTTQ